MSIFHAPLYFFLKKMASRPFFWVCLLFIISFIFRFYLCDYTKHIFLYPDELRYAQLAENFANGKGFLLYNQATDFQKILYPIILAPAFWLEARAMQQHALALINSFFACLTVFPCFFIAQHLLKKTFLIYFITILSLFLPDLTFTLSFMSETVFLPLALFTFYLFLRLFEPNQSYLLSLFCGMICYLLYLCKEIALVFPLAYLFFIPLSHYLKINNNSIAIEVKKVVILMTSFLLCFLLMKLTIFKNMGNSYNQIMYGSIFDLPHLFYLFYGFIYYLMNISIALLCFPLFTPLVYFHSLTQKNKEAFLMLLILIFSSAFVVAYTIFIIEDYANLIPRSLIRYVTYIWLPIFIVFLSLLEIKIQIKNKLQWLYVIFPIFIILVSYRGSLSGFMDYNIIALLDVRRTPSLIMPLKIFFLVFSIIFIFYYKKFKTTLTFILFSILFFFYIFCNYEATPLYWKYYGAQNEKQTMQQLEYFIKNNPDKTFIFANTNWNKTQGLVDTFLNYPNLHVVQIGYLIERQNKKPKVNEELFPLFWAENYYNLNPSYQLDHIHFIILPKELHLNIPSAIHHPNIGDNLFSVFENKTPHNLPKIEFQDYN